MKNSMEEKEIYQLFELARANWEQSFENSRSYALRALRKAEVIGSSKLMAEANNILAVAYFYASDIGQAKLHADNALELMKSNDDPRLVPSIYNTLGMVHFRMDDFAQCLNYYVKSLAYVVRNNNLEQIAVSLCNIGGVFWHCGKLKLEMEDIPAIDELKEVLDSGTELDQSLEELIRKIQNLENKQLGYAFFIRASEIIQDNSTNPRLYVNMMNNLGLWNNSEKKYSEAAHYYDKALGIISKLNMPMLMAGTALNKAENEMDMGEIEQALATVIIAVTKAHELKHKAAECRGMKLLAKVHREMDNHRKALSAFQAYHLLFVDVMNEMEKSELERTKTYYESELKTLREENERLHRIMEMRDKA